ncbi:hypothetical protein CR513_61968, partial [Mucuna pruriens]
NVYSFVSLASPLTVPFPSLFLLNNRDEYHNRQVFYMHAFTYCKIIVAVSWWEGSDDIFGGRDEIGGRTCFGCSREGVFELRSLPQAKTRGDLPAHFLSHLNIVEWKASERICTKAKKGR